MPYKTILLFSNNVIHIILIKSIREVFEYIPDISIYIYIYIYYPQMEFTKSQCVAKNTEILNIRDKRIYKKTRLSQ